MLKSIKGLLRPTFPFLQLHWGFSCFEIAMLRFAAWWSQHSTEEARALPRQVTPRCSQRRAAPRGGDVSSGSRLSFGKSPWSLEPHPPRLRQIIWLHKSVARGVFSPVGLWPMFHCEDNWEEPPGLWSSISPSFPSRTQGRGAGEVAVPATSSAPGKRPSVRHSWWPGALSTQPSQPRPLGDSLTAL